MATMIATATATPTPTLVGSAGGHHNYSFQELWEIIQTNPNKGLRLNKPCGFSSIESVLDSDEQTSAALGIEGMKFHFLKPSGLLSVFSWIQTPLFRDAPFNLANTIRREYGTNFLVELDKKVAGTKFLRKRKAISEWMNTLINLPGILTKEVEMAVSSLCEVQGFHAIMISNFSTETGKEDGHGQGQNQNQNQIQTQFQTQAQIFFSSDPAEWIDDKPVWIIDINGSWIIDLIADNSTISLSSWIEDKETSGWKINWPPVDPDTKKTDMVELLRESILWKESDEKLKKDILAPKYIRYRTLKALRDIHYGDSGKDVMQL